MWVDIDWEIPEKHASLRSSHKLRPRDALAIICLSHLAFPASLPHRASLATDLINSFWRGCDALPFDAHGHGKGVVESCMFS